MVNVMVKKNVEYGKKTQVKIRRTSCRRVLRKSFPDITISEEETSFNRSKMGVRTDSLRDLFLTL